MEKEKLDYFVSCNGMMLLREEKAWAVCLDGSRVLAKFAGQAEAVRYMDTFLTPEELANRLKISTETLQKMRCNRSGPRFIKAGNQVRYPLPYVHLYIQDRSRSSTSSR